MSEFLLGGEVVAAVLLSEQFQFLMTPLGSREGRVVSKEGVHRPRKHVFESVCLVGVVAVGYDVTESKGRVFSVSLVSRKEQEDEKEGARRRA